MKKLLLYLFFIGFLNSLEAQNQAWCAPGATWYYRVYQPSSIGSYQDGHIKLEVTGTVSINNMTCYSMTGTFNGVRTVSTNPVTSSNFVNITTCEDNGVVKIYNPEASNFDTIVNFKAAIGDQWLVIRFPFFNCQNDAIRTPVTVTDTGHVMINNLPLKKIVIAVPYQGISGTYTVALIEKILNVSGFLFPFIYDTCMSDGPSYGSFSCYSDNNFATYNPTATYCAYITGIQNNLANSPDIKLYPNPNDGNFKLELNSVSKTEVINSLGRSVYESTAEAGETKLNVSNLSSGIYYLHIKNNSGQTFLKFVKE